MIMPDFNKGTKSTYYCSRVLKGSQPSGICNGSAYTVSDSFHGGSDGKESACSAEDLVSIPGSRRSPGVGNGYPLQYSCLENPMDKGAWGATVHGVAKESDMTEQLSTHACKFL